MTRVCVCVCGKKLWKLIRIGALCWGGYLYVTSNTLAFTDNEEERGGGGNTFLSLLCAVPGTKTDIA